MFHPKISKRVWVSILSISLLTGLYFGSYGIIDGIIKSQMSASEISEYPEIDSITILAMGDQYMTIDLQILMPNQLQRAISLQLKTTSIYINGSLVGFLAVVLPTTFISFNNPIQHLQLNFTFPDRSLFHQVLQDVINEHDLLIRIETKLILGGVGCIYPAFSLKFENVIQTRPPQQSPSFFDMTLQNVTIDTDTGMFSLCINISVQNPINNSIEITSFHGNLTFNDPDGVTSLFPLLSLFPASHIQLLYLNFTWNNLPFSLPPNGTGSQLIEINATTSVETAYRLFDEYFLKDRMIINLEAGRIVFHIVNYTWDFPFSMLGRNLV